MAVYEIDLTDGRDLDAVDSGGRVAPGWYRATCTDHFENHNKEGDLVFEFTVAGGTFDGQKVFYHIGLPSYAEDEKKAKKAKDRLDAVASRFGLLAPEDKGKKVAIDFDKAIGKEVVIQCSEQKLDKGTFTGLEYLGVYPPDHERIPADVRKTLQLPPARVKSTAASNGTTASANGAATTTATAPAAAKDDFSDL